MTFSVFRLWGHNEPSKFQNKTRTSEVIFIVKYLIPVQMCFTEFLKTYALQKREITVQYQCTANKMYLSIIQSIVSQFILRASSSQGYQMKLRSVLSPFILVQCVQTSYQTSGESLTNESAIWRSDSCSSNRWSRQVCAGQRLAGWWWLYSPQLGCQAFFGPLWSTEADPGRGV